MNDWFTNERLIEIICKWKWHFAAISVIAAIAGIVFSSPYFITPLYTSKAIIYPVNLKTYSEESETEQMLQILQSVEIKNRLIEDFNLAKQYNIDREYRYYRSAIIGKVNENISITRTPFESVEIEISDKNPVQACQMVDSMILYYNSKVRKMHRKKALEKLLDKKAILERIKRETDSLQRKMDSMRLNYGILNYDVQTERLTQGYIVLLNAGRQAEAKKILTQIKHLQKRGGTYRALENKLISAELVYRKTKPEYEEALQEYNKNIAYSQVVTRAEPADRKSYPIRWLFVAGSVCASLLIALFVMIIIRK